MEDPEVVVAGAGIAGLGAAIGLARRGLQVTVIDKDPPPTGIGAEDSFEHWARHSVPQAKQPHLFQARATSKLRDLAPDVFDALLASETQLSGLMLDLLPAEA
ncbi:MAG: FAD-dependent oxidoreductase, partial [Acidimicrobiales bacterium]